jgi:putative ABC transport system permease protein
MRISFNEPTQISVMLAQVKTGEDINVVAENIKRDLRRSRGVKENKEDFSVESPQKAFESYLAILSVVEVLLVGLASISILVGAVGIANTMYTAVLERRREIGVMKAIGAKNSDILQIFIIESAIVGLTGGVIGLVIGMGIGKLIELVLAQVLGTGFFTAYFPWYLTVGALVFAVVIGTVSGILPARQAAAMNPVDALRG